MRIEVGSPTLTAETSDEPDVNAALVLDEDSVAGRAVTLRSTMAESGSEDGVPKPRDTDCFEN